MFSKLINFIKGINHSNTNTYKIPLGRYSDNNKTVAKGKKWTEADNLFKEKKYLEAVNTFFDYLEDDQEKNVLLTKENEHTHFEFYQGSKVIRGKIEHNLLTAEVQLAKMPKPLAPVMRRLLEMNFDLYYSRFAMQENLLCMRFDTSLEAASPSKLYYGLKELAIKSDKQDDLLLQDFPTLESIDNEHIITIPEQEKQVKYDALQNWISETLDKITTVDADKFAGAICYLLLSLIYRIDFLIVPEGQVLNDLEKISDLYFKQEEEKQMVERNRDIIEAFKKLKEKPKEEIFKNLFRSKYTFSIVVPQQHKILADSIREAGINMVWYRDNNQEYFANKILEYGVTFCQYSYSLPRPITQSIEIFMQVNYPEYFTSLGYALVLYSSEHNKFNHREINTRVKQIQKQWIEKYPKFNIDTEEISYDSLLKFNHSFLTQIEQLDMESPA